MRERARPSLCPSRTLVHETRAPPDNPRRCSCAPAHPTSPDADEFRTHTLGQELGPDAYREGILSPRDLWYVSLLHFRGPVEHPENLVTWSHQQLAPTVWTFPVATLCTYETTTTAMRPNIYHTATFGRTIRPHYFDATNGVGGRQVSR